MSSAFTSASFFGQQPKEKRNDQVTYDAVQNVAGGPEASGADESSDVRDSDVNKGNGFSEGPAVVSAPKVATADSKNVQVQNAPVRGNGYRP